MLCEELTRLPEAIRETMTVSPARDERLALYVAAVLAQSFDFSSQLRADYVDSRNSSHIPPNADSQS